MRRLGWISVLFILLVYSVRHVVPPPDAVARSGAVQDSGGVRLFRDQSWQDEEGARQLEQTVFDETFRMIETAGSFVLVDMFLFNDWQGPVAETHRPLSQQLVTALSQRLRNVPEVRIIVISDPINTVYGGLASTHVDQLRRAGATVVLSDLTKLQDSNPVYSALWRTLVSPFGNTPGGSLPNPFGPGTVSLRSWLALLNFKANHRKLIVTDDSSGRLRAMVTSANPHDGSSAHRNVALQFDGAAVDDVLDSERALLEMSEAHEALAQLDEARAALSKPLSQGPSKQASSDGEAVASDDGDPAGARLRLQVVTESAIRNAVLQTIRQSTSSDELQLSMFYLSHRQIITALKEAAQRGVRVRALLDVNSDAFGRRKNGVPNVPVAAELTRAGVQVRWCATVGEQCHEKTLLRRSTDTITLITGSGNFTRRNLDDYNLETDVVVSGPANDPLLHSISEHFTQRWNNDSDRTYSLSYETHANDSPWLTLQYRIMEATGLGTF